VALKKLMEHNQEEDMRLFDLEVVEAVTAIPIREIRLYLLQRDLEEIKYCQWTEAETDCFFRPWNLE
jgi:hypothetical protein